MTPFTLSANQTPATALGDRDLAPLSVVALAQPPGRLFKPRLPPLKFLLFSLWPPPLTSHARFLSQPLQNSNHLRNHPVHAPHHSVGALRHRFSSNFAVFFFFSSKEAVFGPVRAKERQTFSVDGLRHLFSQDSFWFLLCRLKHHQPHPSRFKGQQVSPLDFIIHPLSLTSASHTRFAHVANFSKEKNPSAPEILLIKAATVRETFTCSSPTDGTVLTFSQARRVCDSHRTPDDSVRRSTKLRSQSSLDRLSSIEIQ